MRVEPVARMLVPRLMSPYTSFGERTTHSLNPSTNTPFFLSSRIDKLLRSGFSKSLITSSGHTAARRKRAAREASTVT